jgi:GT2 family glycosyltransferase
MMTASGGPSVAIIVLNWNGLEDTIRCVESLRTISYTNRQIVLVDNGSEGDDVSVLRERFGALVRIIENDRNYGFAEGNNIGIRYALENLDPDYLLLLNNDTALAPDFLTALVDAAEKDARIGVIGPHVYDYYRPAILRRNGAGERFDWWRGRGFPVSSGRPDDRNSDMHEADCIEGSCMLARRSVVERVGILDPEYFAYWEETDWCFRMRNQGYRVCVARNSRIWHRAQPFSKNTRKLYYFLSNNILFMRRNADRKHFLVFLAYFFFVTLPLYCFKPFLRHPLGTAGALTRAVLWNIRH